VYRLPNEVLATPVNENGVYIVGFPGSTFLPNDSFPVVKA